MAKSKKISLTILALVFSIALAFAFIPQGLSVSANEYADEHFDFYLHASEIPTEVTKISESMEIGEFCINVTDQKFMMVDGNSKSSIDGSLTFTRRLKTQDRSVGTDRTISFYLEQKAEITIYAMSASSTGDGRTISLMKNGNSQAIATSGSVALTGNTLEPIVFNTELAGGYYLSFNVGGINIYFIGVKYTGAAEPVQRNDWGEVTTPSIVSAEADRTAGKINVGFAGSIGDNGADYVNVNLYHESDLENAYMTRRYFAYGEFTDTNPATVEFTPTKSGNYVIKASAIRQGEETAKDSATTNVVFVYTMANPSISARTTYGSTPEKLTLTATIIQVSEADNYVIYVKADGATTNLVEETIAADPESETLTYVVADDVLAVNSKYEIGVKALRNAFTVGSENIEASETEYAVALATVRVEPEREWNFTFFGNSTSEQRNVMLAGSNIYDGVTIKSCTFNPDNDVLSAKGGKYTKGGHDGISFYYTKIDANTEDFFLKSTITVDYINPVPDGQEGFALLVRDSLGEHNSNAAYYYSNSAAAMCSKIDPDDMKGVSDGIGARFVTGITSMTDAPSPNTFVNKDLFFDPTIKVSKGNKFVFGLEKKNNCYYARYYDFVTGEILSERKLFHTVDDDPTTTADDLDCDPLCQIDKENVYVGFSVARGCNATFTDIEFRVTEKSTDYIEIEPDPVNPEYTISSPTTSSLAQYNFKFYSSADGALSAKMKYEVEENGETVTKEQTFITGQEMQAMTYYSQLVTLPAREVTFVATFDPKGENDADPDAYKTVDGEPLNYYGPVDVERIVVLKSYGTSQQALIVAPAVDNANIGVIGTPSGDGSMANPLDIQTAINFVLPGQSILMLEGTYEITAGNVTVEKGNDGTADAIKTLRSHPDNQTRPVINFLDKGTGMKLWGNYWHYYGFDVTRTKDKNKGIQLGGHYCVLENVNAYANGDTGIQVSGKSADSYELWPSNNLILNCTSYSNRDSSEEDADGFGAKLYIGENNIFRGCLAYCNIDDGWDLFAKTESGKIGAVTIENCVTFGNGFYLNDVGTVSKGNGNGFKMGGEGLTPVSGQHTIRNSISFANKAKGIDTNSCPNNAVYNCTSVYNGGSNVALYSYFEIVTGYTAEGVLSLLGSSTDTVTEYQPVESVKTDKNFFCYVADGVPTTRNNVTSGDPTVLTTAVFKDWGSKTVFEYLKLEMASKYIGKGDFSYVLSKLTRDADGSLNTNGLFELSETAPQNVGAVIGKTAGSQSGEFTFAGVTFAKGFNDEIQYIESPNNGGNNGGNTGEKPEKNNVVLIVVLCVVGAIVLAGAAVAVFFILKNKKNPTEEVETAEQVENPSNDEGEQQ